MSGITHLGVELTRDEAQDAIGNLQDLMERQEADIERLGAALRLALRFFGDGTRFPVATLRAALQEAGLDP